MSIMVLLLLSALALCLTAMSVAFSSLSTSHLRHWAKKKDPAAVKLYPLKARGSATLLTIELLRAISLSAAIVLLAKSLGTWWAGLLTAAIFFFAFVVLTQLYLKTLGLRLLSFVSRPLLWLTHVLKPVTLPLGSLLDRFIADEPVTLTRAELARLLEGVEEGDTDLSGDELRILRHALSFGDKTVHDVMTPRSVVASVNVGEVLSPVVLNELHKTGHSRFPVVADDGKETVGILYMHDVAELSGHPQSVKDVMRRKVIFVNEERELDHVLQAFLKSKQHLFVVVNAFSEAVGLVTIEDVVEQILGKPIVDEFDTYEDMRAVAEARAKQTKHDTPEI